MWCPLSVRDNSVCWYTVYCLGHINNETNLPWSLFSAAHIKIIVKSDLNLKKKTACSICGKSCVHVNVTYILSCLKNKNSMKETTAFYLSIRDMDFREDYLKFNRF